MADALISVPGFQRSPSPPRAGASDQCARVRAHFDDEAGMWTDLYARTDPLSVGMQIRMELAEALLLRVVPAGGLRILEVGCGGGLFTQRLANLGHEVHGIDISEKMIASAQTNLAAASENIRENVRFSVANIADPSTMPDTYDLVVALGLFEYLPPATATSCLTRSLTRGGRILVSVPNPARLAFRAAGFRQAISRRFWRLNTLAARFRRTRRPAEHADVAPGFHRNNMTPDDFDFAWEREGLSREVYAAYGFDCVSRVARIVPLIGGPTARRLERRLAFVRQSGCRRRANLAACYLAVYRKTR